MLGTEPIPRLLSYLRIDFTARMFEMSTQTWNPSRYAANAAFVPALGQPVLELLQPRSGERILDLGCGDGILTQKLAATGAEVVGVDSSPEMVAAARQRGLDARVMDATKLTFEHEFDAVFSNAALHWIKDAPDAAIASAYRALRRPGRFVGEMGGHGCVAAVVLALIVGLEKRGIKNAASICPWYFPTVDDYSSRLERAGFVAESVQLIPRPTPLPSGMRGWLETFANPFCAALPEAEREDYLEEGTQLLRSVLSDEKGRWTADYMRLRFIARKQ
ncbi:MAG TPA: methyltransferase domain-containing protein [Candidatus Sulfotelmatobacter sp.]|nr:methyltransferase domain-containing protein [Candidatus Sulfotelmatobacter sp.]